MKILRILPLLYFFSFLGCEPSKSTESGEKAQDSVLEDDSLLTLVQKQTFNYFWDGAEPVSGLACERVHLDGIYPHNDQNVVTSGGSGFGLSNCI